MYPRAVSEKVSVYKKNIISDVSNYKNNVGENRIKQPKNNMQEKTWYILPKEKEKFQDELGLSRVS